MKRFFWWALLLSLLIHLIILILYSEWENIRLFPAEEKKLPGAISQKSIQFELVETPPQEEAKPENAEYLSDQSAIAKNRQRIPSIHYNDPYQKGDVDHGELLSTPLINRMNDRRHTASENKLRHSDESGFFEKEEGGKISPSRAFSVEQLLGLQESYQSSRPSMLRNRQNGYVEELGSFSLNTYAWEYAPYLLEVKRRIQRNLFPPPSFTHLGMGGENVLRFRILADGTLISPQLLAYQGERVLIETSGNAVKVSAPFPPLPDDFPEEYLEVTAKFQYIIIRP